MDEWRPIQDGPEAGPAEDAFVGAVLDIHRALLARGGQYISLTTDQDLAGQPALIQCNWPELTRALKQPTGAVVTCLIAPWRWGTPIPVEVYLNEVLASLQTPAHACILVVEAADLSSTALWLDGVRSIHLAVADASARRVIEPPDRPTPLATLFSDAQSARASALDPAEVMRRLAADMERARAFRDRLVRLTPWTPVTAALCGLCVAVYAAMTLWGVSALWPGADDLIVWGANGGFLAARGDWWRCLTSTFVHGGIIHLAVNMWCLWNLGQFVERLFGSVTFAVVYLLAAVGGALASVATKPVAVSVGASGAIFGVAGALAGFLVVRRKSLPSRLLRSLARNMAVFLAANLALGFALDFVDNAAHIGGLATGLVAGMALSRDLEREDRRRLVWRLLIGTVFAVVLVGAGALVDRAVLRSPRWASLVFLRACGEEYDRDVGGAAKDMGASGWRAGPASSPPLGPQRVAAVRAARQRFGAWPSSAARDLAVEAADALAHAMEAALSARWGAARSGLERFRSAHQKLVAEAGRLGEKD